MFYIIAFFCGILINIQLLLNAELGKKVGLIQSTFINFGSALFILILGTFTLKTSLDFGHLKNVPLIFFTGGFLAIIINLASNYLIPKLPLIYSTIFTFLGQMVTSLFIDYLTGFRFSLTKLSGYGLVILGIFYIVYMDYKEGNKQ